MRRSNTPNCAVLERLKEHSNRGWVYREGQGWIFAELTPDELAEFKPYKCGAITIPRMKVRLPYYQAWWASYPYLNDYANCFAYCTMRQAHPLLLSKFHIRQITDDDEHISRIGPPIEIGDYEIWLWADEVEFFRELDCEITVRHGWCWCEWGVPPEWKAPIQYEERIFIYAFVDDLKMQVYVGQTEHIEQRQASHLRDIKNLEKVALIQSLRAQGREPKPIKLEEVAGKDAGKRERYWTSYYKSQGYTIINKDFKSLSGFTKKG